MADDNEENLGIDVGGLDGDSQDPITPDEPNGEGISLDGNEDINLYSIITNNYTGEGYFELRIKNNNTESEESEYVDVSLKDFQSYKFIDSPEGEDLEIIVPNIFKNHNFEDGTNYWEINFISGDGSYEVLQDEETEEHYLQVTINEDSECTIKQLVDFTNCDSITFRYDFSNMGDVILEHNIYASTINPSSEDNESSNDDYDEDWMPSLVVDTKQSSNTNKTFQARVFHEKNNEVYGAEIVLIPRDEGCPIETILITDKIKLDSFNGLVQNMERCYVPYTKDDVDNLEIYKKVASGELSESDMEYRNMVWSKLHKKGDLKTILENKINLPDEEFDNYDSNDITIINATHLSGFNSGDFVKLDELDNLLKYKFTDKNHETLSASTSRAGHAFIVDNLNESSVTGGRVLSANQGRILNEKISSLESLVNNGWSKERKIGKYITYTVNEGLRLIVCNYNRENYRGFQSETGTQILEGKNTINEEYTPSANVSIPLVRGDVTLTYTKNGEILIHSLTKQSNFDINSKSMWNY